MKTNLMKIRKERGYRTREDFANAFGISKNTLRTWEDGTTNFSLQSACELADFLHCTLDELAGRKPPYNQVTPLEQMLVDDFRQLDNTQKRLISATIHSMTPSYDMEEKNETRDKVG